MAVCERCHCETEVTTMSRFNTQMICLGCEEEERSRPDYKDAVEAEIAAIRNGNYNFVGIGM